MKRAIFHHNYNAIYLDAKEKAMPKRAIPFSIPDIGLDHRSPLPLYRQLYERLHTAIITGQLEAGVRLPSTRSLASELGISRTTTELVYEQLLMEGYLESRVGHGTRVSGLFPRQPVEPRPKAGTQKHSVEQRRTPIVLSLRGQALLQTTSEDGPFAFRLSDGASPFRVGQPDVAAFPYDLWARLLAKHARQSLRTVTSYQSAEGYGPLREAIASHIGITRGVRCTPQQVLLTAGSQGALDLAARVLLDPGETAWIENPGYPGARGALLAAGAKTTPVPIDEEGIEVVVGDQLAPHARIVSVTPSHQFPTGVTMSLNRRLALLAWARQAQAWILEDDYDSEYRFSGRPLEALQSLDNGQRVIYIGTFSKVLFPALRLGYVVVPTELIEGFVAMRRCIDVHVPIVEQMALTDFLTQGHFTRHLRQMRTLYSERRTALIDALKRELSGLLEIHPPEAGMHLVAWLPPGKDDRVAAHLVRSQGIEIDPISRFSMTPLERGGLLFGYSAATSEDLRVAVQHLARALHML